jgi:hypothetical protein
MGGAAVNYLELAPEDRPALPTRAEPGAPIEVQCPVCQQWRAGFLIESDGAGGWNCDAERSIVVREAEVAAAALLPPPERRLTKPEFLDLWTPLETVTVMQTTDGLMAYLWARTLAWDGPFLMSDSRVIAGITRAQELAIITPESAARKLAGLLPE